MRIARLAQSLPKEAHQAGLRFTYNVCILVVIVAIRGTPRYPAQSKTSSPKVHEAVVTLPNIMIHLWLPSNGEFGGGHYEGLKECYE